LIKKPKLEFQFEIERPLGDSSEINSVGCMAAGGKYEKNTRDNCIFQFGAGDFLVSGGGNGNGRSGRWVRGSALVAKYTPVKLTTDLTVLTDRQREMIPLLIEAAQIMDQLFWKDAYGDREALLTSPLVRISTLPT
jgi:hypothetical protein